MAPLGSWRWLLLAAGLGVAVAGSSGCCGLSERYHGADCDCGLGEACPACDRCLAAGEAYAHEPGGCLHCRHRHGGHGLLHHGHAGHLGMTPGEEPPFMPPLSRYHPVPTRPVFEPQP